MRDKIGNALIRLGRRVRQSEPSVTFVGPTSLDAEAFGRAMDHARRTAALRRVRFER